MKWLLECKYFHKSRRGRQKKVVSFFWDDEEKKMVFYEEPERTVYSYLYTKGDIDEVRSILGNDVAKLSRDKHPHYEIKYNSMDRTKHAYLKLYTDDPNSIGGRTGIRDYLRPFSWQDDVKYYYVYATEKKLNFGMPYEWGEGEFPRMIKPDINLDKMIDEIGDRQLKRRIQQNLAEVFANYPKDIVDFYFQFFFSPVPDIPFAGIDIEVETVRNFFPDAFLAEHPITTIGIAWSSGERMVLMLEREDMGEKWEDRDYKVKYFKTEKELLEYAFEVFVQLPPIVLTYNGDDFDFQYMHMRATRYYGLRSPFILIPRKGKWKSSKLEIERMELRSHLHFDLNVWFAKPPVRNYIYRGKYPDAGLDTVAKTLVGEGKLFKQAGDTVGTNYRDEGRYCFQDALLCNKLWLITRNIVFMMMRLTNTTFQDICRRGISAWHADLLRREFHRKNWIAPNMFELARTAEATTQSTIEGKTFKGALVKAEPGIYTMGTVVDFASLYVSIIEQHNLSFETINCECCDPIENRVPETGHWVCQKVKGIIPVLYGFFRAIRVAFFKPLKIDDVEQGLKVLLNSCFGAFGFISFVFFCLAMAECITALGRQKVSLLQERIQDLGIWVMFGDTDSAGLLTQDDNLLDEIIKWSKRYLLTDLEVDYKFKVMFLCMKKNYIVIYNDGTSKVVGLKGKKKDTPKIFKDCFNEIVEVLEQIEVES